MPAELRQHIEARRPARASVYAPMTRREVARLCGADVAGKMGEMTVDDVRRLHGEESAKRYAEKLKTEGE
jgi:hypothetical protein